MRSVFQDIFQRLTLPRLVETSNVWHAAITAAAMSAMAGEAHAALGFTVEANNWPNADHRNDAVAAIQSAVNRYNAYGDFGNANIYVYYNAGIPTAQANYLGSVGFGQTYPNERVMMHEVAHYLGSGTYGDPWDGPRGEAMVDQFDGLEATLQGDASHFWPYGLNYDSEGSEINKQRQVALLYAQRADMGIGSTATPGTATAVNLTGSDAIGESGFNYASKWSDNRFARAGAAYTTGDFTFRTPASANSFSFVGDSVTVNNTNSFNGGLLYKGSGTTGVITFKDLKLSGGYTRHASGSGDLFQLAGKVTLTGSPTIDAAQGPITVSANIGGTGSLTKTGPFVVTLSGGNNYAGNTTINGGTLRLALTNPVASYSFDNVSGNVVVNGGTGGAAMNGALANGAAIVGGGRFGNAVSLAGGASVDINNPIADLGNNSSWTVSTWVKTTLAGASILTKGDGGWTNGNTIFYLGDGTGPGSGARPSAVRYAGGFFQAAAGATVVNDNNWHQITYVNGNGAYAIYVDGVAQTLSAGNSSFANGDVGSIVRLGVSTNTVPADGTLNYNGLLDSVQFYGQALSAAQIAALFQGQSLAPLPLTTNVSIASGATLDLNGITQQIASLTGASGSSVTLGAGQLIVSSATSSQFSGAISGAGGTLVKAGNSTLTLSGATSYTGLTTINGGTLAMLSVAQSPVVSGAGANITNGYLVLDHTGGPMPLDVKTILTNGFNQSPTKFATGRLRSTTADTSKGLGWKDDGSRTIVGYTYYGDADLNGTVNTQDFTALALSFNATTGIWSTGDFNYDGKVNALDFNALASNFGRTIVTPGEPIPGDVLGMLVPEPGALLLGSLGLAHLSTRRRRIG